MIEFYLTKEDVIMTARTAPLRLKATVYVLDPVTYTASVKFPGAWTVEKINPKTAKLSQLIGAGPQKRILACDKALIVSDPPPAVGLADYRSPWNQGQTVRWVNAPLDKTGGMSLFTIITDDGGATIARMVPLGNESGRYWRRVPARDLIPVSLDELLKPGTVR
jgi:hypothetical protein